MQRQARIDAAINNVNMPDYRDEDIEQGLDHLWQAMQDCISNGLAAEGELPGGLKVKRRAKALAANLNDDDQRNAKFDHTVMDWISLFALAVNVMDRFLCQCPVRKSQLQLVGSVCILIASKIREPCPIPGQTLIVYTDYSITSEELKVRENNFGFFIVCKSCEIACFMGGHGVRKMHNRIFSGRQKRYFGKKKSIKNFEEEEKRRHKFSFDCVWGPASSIEFLHLRW